MSLQSHKARTRSAPPRVANRHKTRRRKRAVLRKRRTRKRTQKRKRRTRSRRGRGAACSRPRVDSEVTEDTVEAEPMPENLPLPPGSVRVPAVDPNTDLPSAVAAPAPLVTGETLNTGASLATNDAVPVATDITRSKYPTPSRGTVQGIMGFPEYDILRTDPRSEEIRDAMANYIYHPNYFDTFGAPSRDVDEQLFNLVMGWYSENASDPNAIDYLLYALRSPRHEEIGF